MTRASWQSSRLPRELSAELLEEAQLPPGCIDLTNGNPTTCELELAPMRLALDLNLAYVPDAQGPARARAALAAMCIEMGRPSHADRFVLTSGSCEALGLIFRVVCNPADAVVVCEPGYPLVRHVAELEGLTVRTCTSLFSEGRWQLDLASLAASLASGAKVVVLVSPNNPTGARLSHATLKAVAQLCRTWQAVCVFDEVFAAYGRHAPHAQLCDLSFFDRAISLGGLSKAALLPQLKLSWLELHGHAAWVKEASTALIWASDTYLTVNQAVAAALPEILTALPERQKAMRKRIDANEAWLADFVRHRAIGELLARDGGWYCILRLSSIHARAVMKRSADCGLTSVGYLEKEANVRLLPTLLFDLDWPQALVVSLLAPPSLWHQGWQRLAKVFAGLAVVASGPPRSV